MTDSSQLGENIVKITVGTRNNSKTFPVHKQILCQKITYFDKMFNGPFQEGRTQSTIMPEDDPAAFEALLGWAYLDKIEHFTLAGLEGRLLPNMALHARLFVLAEKYGIMKVADGTLDHINKECLRTQTMPPTWLMELCYKLTHEESKLRQWTARCFAYITLALKPNVADGAWSNENMCKLIATNSDLARDRYTLIHSANKTF